MSGLNPPGPLAYAGQVAVPSIQRNFAPTTSDNNFGVPTVWTFPSAKKAYILVNKELGVADWLLFATSTGPIDSFLTDDGHTVLPNGTGVVDLAGGANVTTSSVNLSNTATFSLSGTTQHAVQIGNAGGSLTSAVVATNGQVMLGATGADPAFATLTSTDGSIVYTTGANALNLAVNGSSFGQTITGITGGPLSPTAGNWNILAAATASGTTPIKTAGSGSTLTIDVQKAATAATTTANIEGLASFDSHFFTIDGNGWVTTNSAHLGETITGDSGGALSPTSGNWNIIGGTVAAGTSPVKTAGSVSTLTVNVQTSQAIASTDATKIGLSAFNSTEFTVDANGFVSLAGGGAGLTITGDSGGAISPSAGNWNLIGGVVTAGTSPLKVAGSGSTLTVNAQISGSAGTTTANILGLASFNSNQFSVDGNGWVSLAGGGSAAIETIGVDSGHSPLTGAAINLNSGANFATGTSANSIAVTAPVDNSHGVIAVQLAGSNAATSTANDFGVAQFDSNQFAVTSGFVQLKGGGVNPALTSIVMDAGTSPIVPNSSGQMTFTGAQVATGVVGTNVIRSDGTGANTMAIQIQRTTTSAVTNVALNGVCHFSSTNFSVDANGFVTFVGGSSSFPWTDEGGNFNAASNNGYFTTATLTATLPPTPANGDIIRVVVDTTQITTLQANTGQKIRIGNVISSMAGTSVNTRQGDSIDLVYRSASATWYAFSGTVGTWGVT